MTDQALISALPAITGANTASDDLFIVEDTSAGATSGITRAEMKVAMGISPTDSPTFTNATITGAGGAGSIQFKLGDSSLSTGNVNLYLGTGRTGDGACTLRFVTDTTYSAYGFQFARTGGANASSIMYHRGTGALQFYTVDSASIVFKTNSTTAITIDTNQRTTFSAAIILKSFTVGTLPSASAAGAGAQVYVSNETGGAVPAFSDGTNWRRYTDRAIVT